jgi:hypothetical protein
MTYSDGDLGFQDPLLFLVMPQPWHNGKVGIKQWYFHLTSFFVISNSYHLHCMTYNYASSVFNRCLFSAHLRILQDNLFIAKLSTRILGTHWKGLNKTEHIRKDHLTTTHAAVSPVTIKAVSTSFLLSAFTNVTVYENNYIVP